MRASGVYYCWIARVLSWLLHSLGSVSHSLSFKSPGTEPIREVLECLQAICSVDNLRRVVASKECIWRLIHFLGGNAEADHGVVDDAVVLERPEVMQLLLTHVFMGRESQNTIRFLSKTLRFV